METLEQKIDALRAIGLFAEVPTARLRPVAQAVKVVHFGAGEVIVRQGDPGDAVYALIGGTAEVWLEHVPDRPVLLRTLRSGQLFGETAVLYRGPRSATIKANSDVTTLKLPGPVFLELLQSSPDLAVRVAVILAQRLASDRYALASDPMTPGAA
jgi:CRP/FNR family transcriptional regulator, cyclic AMP receptor protein